MIVLNLQCGHEHRFEGWFASADAFDEQLRRGMVACPVCNDAAVTRLPSAPRVVSKGRDEPAGESLAAVQRQLLEIVRDQLRASENVGVRFPEEARKIHYNEAPARNIHGVASIEDARDLLEEGIAVLPLPPSEETH